MANTPGVAFAEPTDSRFVLVHLLIRRRLRVRHQIPRQVRHRRVRLRQQIRRPQRLAPRQVRRLGLCRVRLTPKPVRPPHRVTLRRQTHALGLCRVRAARTPALHRRAATPPHQPGRRPPNRGTRCRRHGCTRRATGRRRCPPQQPDCSVAHRATGRAGTLRRAGAIAVAQGGKPETPVATAAAPTPDAPHGESHTAPNSAGSDPTNRSGSASSTSANRQSTVVVGAAATPASTAQPRTATEAAVESVASTYSAAEAVLLRRERFQSRPVPRWHRRTSYPASCQVSWHGWA